MLYIARGNDARAGVSFGKCIVLNRMGSIEVETGTNRFHSAYAACLLYADYTSLYVAYF